MNSPSRDDLALAAACYLIPPHMRKIVRLTRAVEEGLSYWIVPRGWPTTVGDFLGFTGLESTSEIYMTRDEEIVEAKRLIGLL